MKTVQTNTLHKSVKAASWNLKTRQILFATTFFLLLTSLSFAQKSDKTSKSQTESKSLSKSEAVL
ncbi:MAG: hypothetical protein WCR71_02145, partial [Bacteroidales bacterium]